MKKVDIEITATDANIIFTKIQFITKWKGKGTEYFTKTIWGKVDTYVRITYSYYK